MNDIWLNWAEQRGYRVTFGNASLLEKVNSFIENKRKEAQFDKRFYNHWLKELEISNYGSMATNESLVLIAVPKPAFKIPFKYKGESKLAILPPTYTCYRPTFKQIRDEASTVFEKYRYRIEVLNAPLKSLAVSTGLVKYGRNNITYHPEMGSYFQLVGLISDMSLEPGAAFAKLDNENNLMTICQTCQACLKACPTGAIDKDRLLLHAEKCYTQFSETSGDLPETPLPPSPECVIGCMKCQMVCPINKGKLLYEEAPFAFSDEETSFLVSNFDREAYLGQKICQKFNLLHLTENCELYARNLRRLVKLSLH